MSRNKYTKELLEDAISKSTTMAEVLKRLGVRQSGSLHYHLMLKAKKFGIDLSHFKGKSFVKKDRKKMLPARLEEVCVEKSNYSRFHLKRRLIREGILKNECSVCHLPTEWNCKNLVMVLDHINGVRDDNRLENLRLLCPNCNSQQDTFCGRNSSMVKRFCEAGCGRKIPNNNKSGFCGKCLFQKGLKDMNCPICGEIKSRNSPFCEVCLQKNKTENSLPIDKNNICECGSWKEEKSPRCIKCSHFKNRKVKRPTKEELEFLIKEKPMTKIGEMFNVSDNAVRKWCKTYSIENF
jgi:hypothetical protein